MHGNIARDRTRRVKADMLPDFVTFNINQPMNIKSKKKKRRSRFASIIIAFFPLIMWGLKDDHSERDTTARLIRTTLVAAESLQACPTITRLYCIGEDED